jgi:hypothetical protein
MRPVLLLMGMRMRQMQKCRRSWVASVDRMRHTCRIPIERAHAAGWWIQTRPPKWARPAPVGSIARPRRVLAQRLAARASRGQSAHNVPRWFRDPPFCQRASIAHALQWLQCDLQARWRAARSRSHRLSRGVVRTTEAWSPTETGQICCRGELHCRVGLARRCPAKEDARPTATTTNTP